MEALWTLVAHVQDLVIDIIDGLPSLAASLSMAVGLFEGRINDAAANKVQWGTWSALVATFLGAT
jgi:hypothetical protein